MKNKKSIIILSSVIVVFVITIISVTVIRANSFNIALHDYGYEKKYGITTIDKGIDYKGNEYLIGLVYKNENEFNIVHFEKNSTRLLEGKTGSFISTYNANLAITMNEGQIQYVNKSFCYIKTTKKEINIDMMNIPKNSCMIVDKLGQNGETIITLIQYDNIVDYDFESNLHICDVI